MSHAPSHPIPSHLVLSAHPNPASFNRALRDTVCGAAVRLGHRVVVRDLYADPLDPVLGPDDFAAWGAGGAPAEVAREQALVRDADVVTLVFPMWWSGPPALLKGWLDRVLSHGFAYRHEDGRLVRPLAGKRAVVLCTAGQPEGDAGAAAQRAALATAFEEGVFGFLGMEVVHRRVYPGVPLADDAARAAWLRGLDEDLRRVLPAAAAVAG